jgi:DNA-directed RNA polymerase specialized sigma24 family protein
LRLLTSKNQVYENDARLENIEKIAKLHKEWVEIVKTFGAGNMSEDIVQDTYFRILRLDYADKFVSKEVNKGYMWLTLRSVYFDYLRANKNREVSIDKFYSLSDKQKNPFEDEASLIISEKIEAEIDSWHWYDGFLFRVYKDSGFSMRDISDKSGISLSSIFTTIKTCKGNLKRRIGEDYEDYLNKDFELIK